MAENTLLEAFSSQQLIAEAERNLASKPPQTLPALRMIVARCLQIVSNPGPADLLPYTG